MRYLPSRADAFFCLTLASSALFPMTALSQAGDGLREFSTTSVSATGAASSSPQLGEELLRLSDRIAALERLVALLVARQDEGLRDAAQLASEFARFRADAEARIETIEREIANVVAAPAPGTAIELADAIPLQPADQASLVPRPVDRFEQGLAFADRQDWAQAELAFETFIANNPDDQRLPSARYQLGLAYLGQQQPAQAARIFLDLFESGDAAAFGADNLFALALALHELDPESLEQICTVYSEIETSYGEVLTTNQREKLLDNRLTAACAQ